jgi:hypothetical protein
VAIIAKGLKITKSLRKIDKLRTRHFCYQAKQNHMSKGHFGTISALRNTANALENSNDYQWGHMGSCNCGFLAREISKLSKSQIHARAMERSGDWTEQLNDYCPSSGILMDDLIATIFNFGFSIDELRHLERLSDPLVLRALSTHERNLQYNKKDDAVKYLRAWANLLEQNLIKSVNLSALMPVASSVKLLEIESV